MQSATDVIVHSLAGSKNLLLLMVKDLAPEEWLKTATPAANCAAWVVGHLTSIDRFVVRTVAGPDAPLPSVPAGFDERYARGTSGCTPGAFAADVAALPELFARTRDVLIERATALPVADLDKPLPFNNPLFKTFGELMNFHGLHTAMHTGQVSTLRRSLGRPALF